nr:hypothetical protein [Tanacetum cinerariifolium]
GAPSEPPTDLAFVPRSDDRYAIVRDAVTSDVRDDGDDPSVPSDPNHHSHVNLPVIIS